MVAAAGRTTNIAVPGFVRPDQLQEVRVGRILATPIEVLDRTGLSARQDYTALGPSVSERAHCPQLAPGSPVVVGLGIGLSYFMHQRQLRADRSEERV